MHGVEEFCEVFYDDVLVPFERTLGEVDRGWAVAMDLLPYERSTSLWHRGAYLHRRMERDALSGTRGALTAAEVGEAAQNLYAFRARSRATQRRMAAGDRLGPETSVDKVLVAAAEQAVFDLVADGLAGGTWPVTTPRANAGDRSSCTRGRRRSTGEVRRSSATSSPAGSWIWETTDDGGADLEIFEGSLRQATSRHSGQALDAALVDLGWLDALESDAYTAVSLLFRLQGAANATSFALDRVLMTGLDRGSALELAVVLPSLGRWSAPGQMIGADLTFQGLGTSALRQHSTALVVAKTDDPTVAAVVEVDTADLTLRCVDGVDPLFGLVEVSGDTVPYAHRSDIASTGWDASVGLAQVALGYELVGAARTMLELAREHALNRVQFGQPISRFQAVRHRLAETLVAIEAADAVLGAAGEDPSLQLSAAAKAMSGRGARDGQPSLPAGAGGDRLHRRAPLSQVSEASADPRSAPRYITVADRSPGQRTTGRPPHGHPPAPLKGRA